MGIRGLKSFLESKLSGVICASTLPLESTLVVDGDGWLYYLVERCEGLRPELGGCYDLLAESINEEIAALRSCGLQLVVYFDGPNQRMKLATSEKRMLQRIEQWIWFYDFCEENVSLSEEDSFPLPALVKAQLIDSLKRCGVSFVTCAGEADQEVAKLVSAGNAGCAVGQERFFAYGRDSDYLAMRACPYIEFGAIEAVVAAPSRQQQQPAPGPSPAAGPGSSPAPSPSKATKAAQLRQRPTHVAQCARVWRRNEICEALSVTEAQFVDWAILVGNDYTSDLSRADVFDWESGAADAVSDDTQSTTALSAGYGHNALGELLQAIVARGERRIIAAAWGGVEEERESLQLAIDYSRAVYELQSLECFPLDAGLATLPVMAEDSSCVQDGFVGPMDVLRWFRSSYGQDKEDEGTTESGTSPGFFSDLHQYVAEVCEASSKPQKKLGVAEHALAYIRWKAARSNAPAEVSTQQVLALESMLRRIYADAEARKEATRSLQQLAASPPANRTPARESLGAEGPVPSDSFPHRPRWRDVVAAHAFQKACSLLGKVLPQDAYRAKYNNPQSIYHGAYFHSVLRLMEEQQSVATSVPRSLGAPSSPPDDVRLTPATPMAAGTVAAEVPGTPASSAPATKVAPAASDALPIDAFREEIIRRIERDRVTIIHGETGCGKSSCLPRFLLEHAEAASPQLPCQIMVSQPRRIAVTSLLRRLRETLGSKVGMRMGHGIRDDSPDTKIHYVTTGYLVRALAHQPERFLKCTHLIIDEVHERSVDGDLVCLLARDLLRTHPTLRVVLMSATIHTSLYRDYFAQQDDGSYGDMECLSVGVRRFPVSITYPEDILEAPVSAIGSSRANFAAFAPQIQAAAREIVKLTDSAGGSGSDVPAKLALAQYKAAVNLVRACCAEGTGVLIFVSGINDITEIVQMFEAYPKYLLFPIHSDIPADEQELAFGVTPADKVKVVVATNAAESSVTIPDCDMVICLGTHKSLQYSALNHRTQLVNTWISKASSTQRAGRTGRVRPGKVFRLYSRKLFEAMHEHEVAEVHRRPLQDVVLGMWVMLEDAANFHGVTPFLQGLIEAPDMRNIEQSYQYLYESDLVTHPSDQGYLTAVGRLSGELPVDIALGRMIACGVILGVAAEAVVLAAALTLPKSPFRYANAMYSDPEEFSAIVRAKFLTAAEFDGGAYSEPIALLNLLRKWRTLDARSIPGFCHKRGLVQAVMKQFKSMSDHLAHTVTTRLRPARGAGSSRSASSSADIDLARMGPLTSRKRNLLRLILLWSSSGNVLRLKKKSGKRLTDTSVLVHSNEVTSDHMRGLFGESVPYKYETRGKRVYDAHLTYWAAENYFAPLVRVLDGMADMAAEHGVDCYWVVVKSDSNHSTMVVMVVPHGKRTEGVLGLLCTHVFKQEERLLAPGGREIAKAIEENAARLGDAVVLVVPDASKSEVKCLNDFRDYLDGSLAMLVPVVGTAKLTASNCCPSQDSLSKVFFGSEYDTIPTTDRKIACQTTGSRCLLSFPDHQEWDGRGANLSEDDDDSDESDDGLSSEGNATRPLIDDLPLGHRLINCCCQQVGKTRDKHLVLKRSEEAEAHAARVAVPGSLQYAKQHPQEGGPAVDVARIEQKLEVKLGCITANWTNIRGLKTTPVTQEGGDELPVQSSVAAFLPRQTLLSCSFHMGAESLFAVAHTTLLLGAAGTLVACEGVTFMPPGATWMYLALLCAGADAKQLLAMCPDVEPEVRVTQEQCDAAEEVATLMRGASTIVHRPDITAMISAAFEPAGGDSDSWEGTENSDAEFSDDDDVAAQLAGLRLDGTPGRKSDARTPAKAASGHFRGSATPPSAVPLIVQQGMRRGKSPASTPASKAAKQEQKKADKKARKEAAAQEQKARRAAMKLAKAEKKLTKAATSKAAAVLAAVAAATPSPSPAGAKRAGPAPLTPTQVITAKSKGKGKKT